MKSKRPTTSFAPYEIRRFILPLTLGTIASLIWIIVEHLLNESSHDILLLIYAILAILYAAVNSALIARTTQYNERYGWINAIMGGGGVGLLFYILAERNEEIIHLLVVFGTIAVATVSGRKLALTNLLSTLAVRLAGK